MPFEDIYVVSDKREVVTDDQVTVAEAALGTHFPDGYREYVTRLGKGYCNAFARVLLPSEILAEKTEFQEGWAMVARSRYKKGFDLLPLRRMVEAIILMGTIDGDDIVFHPDTPSVLYMLPRQDVEIYEVGRTLDEALTWVLKPGHLSIAEQTSVLTAEGQFVDYPVRYFEPDVEREGQGFLLLRAQYAEVRASLIALAQAMPGGTLCVRYRYTKPDGTEGEALRLFVREYGGEILCDPEAEQEGMRVTVEYDDDRRTESLDRLLAYLQRLAR